MFAWLSHIDPNTVISIIAAVVVYAYHRLVPPAQQSAIDHAIASVRAVLAAAVAAEAPGKSARDLEVMLRGFAAVQLAKLGYTGPLSPLLQAAVDAAVHEAIVLYGAP